MILMAKKKNEVNNDDNIEKNLLENNYNKFD